MEAPIQWYPGHIAKLERQLQEILKPLDVIIELVDARIPYTTWHQDLSDKIRAKKPVLLVLNKADLADPVWTQRWVAYFQKQYPLVMPFESTRGQGKGKVIEAVCRLGEEKLSQLEKKGLKRRPLRTGVVGMPNVGKSTLINCLVGQKKAKTGHRAGVTRVTQWVRIHPQVELLDMPGLIPSQLASVEAGQRLACVYSVGDAAFDEEAILPFFLETVERHYPGQLAKALDMAPESPITMEAIAQRRQCLLPAGEVDLKRTAQGVLKDFRLGRLGRLTLERPPT